MRPLSIGEVEQETGVGRNTIYHYIRSGLLPPAQKASATRAIYNETHVELLGEIARLKAEGLDLRQIRDTLAERIEAAAENGVDLVARQNEEMHRAILQAAARRFAEGGYEQARVADICSDVGVTAQLLYSHFPSKRHLFIACYEVYFEWMHEQVVPPIERTVDSAARLAWRSWASYGIQALSPDLQALARVEAFHPESELRPLVREIYGRILAGTEDELAADRRAGANHGLFDDELVSYALIGALEDMQMRASWDDRFGKRDVMRNLLGIFLAVRAAHQGRVDLSEDWAKVDVLVNELANSAPEMGDLAPA
jgi:AcrR family transcriptional regulator